MKFTDFAAYLARLEETSSRTEITKILAELLGTLDTKEIKEATYLLTGTVAPSYSGIVFNLADKMLLRALADAFDVSAEVVNSTYRKLGDLGLVAEALSKSKKAQDLSIREMYEALLLLTKEGGEGSQDRRIGLLTDLYQKTSALTSKYITRIITGNLRLGFSEKTIVDALSWMETGGKTKSTSIMKAFEVLPDIGEIARLVKEKGIEKTILNVTPIVGIPVQPMLCQRLKSPSEMVKKMGEVSVEPKFDGLRVLIHYSKKKNILKCFTRNLKDISLMFPELSNIAKHINADEVILDTEAVGMDPDLIKIADFQTTMQRRRKHEIDDVSSKIPVTFQVFDIIFKNGESLMDKTYVERREVLTKTIKNGSLFVVDNNTITTDPEKIAKLHEEYLAKGLEGIIVKRVDSTYVPGRLGNRWVKMKEAESATGKLADTVDAVIMGFSAGQGKRVGFGIGQFLAGVLDGDKIKTVTKVGTGLTDTQFRQLNEVLEKLKVSEMPKEYEVHKNLTPDFWVKPKVVVELAADDITVSPNHTAGFAMRFPRLVRLRAEKGVKDASAVKEIKELFDLQKK